MLCWKDSLFKRQRHEFHFFGCTIIVPPYNRQSGPVFVCCLCMCSRQNNNICSRDQTSPRHQDSILQIFGCSSLCAVVMEEDVQIRSHYLMKGLLPRQALALLSQLLLVRLVMPSLQVPVLLSQSSWWSYLETVSILCLMIRQA